MKQKDLTLNKFVDLEGFTKYCNVNIILYESKKDSRKMQDLHSGKFLVRFNTKEKRLSHSKHRTAGRSLFLHQKEGCTMQKMGMQKLLAGIYVRRESGKAS